ncbi:hypothetical protein GCM10009102_18130 [Sphingomonas insulae]|uniref:Uncharacterized protein n=1 Tax=Sphingomonas insulae TaxID=424800 RepID=A0ABP3T4G9_9SPHN
MLAALPVLRAGRIVLGQLDALAIDMVDGADMDAIGADDLHMLLDVAMIVHATSPVMGSGVKRADPELDASPRGAHH